MYVGYHSTILVPIISHIHEYTLSKGPSMPDTETFFAKLTDINFTVRNLSPYRRIRIFNYPINPGQTRDLLAIPEISEADIRHSLIKGELANFIRMRVISVVSSSIDLLQFDTSQTSFLANAGVPLSTLTITSSSSPTGSAGGDLTGLYPNPTLIPVGTAGTYGDPSHFPVITTDTKGRVISVYSQVLSSFSGASASGDLTGSYPGPTLISVGIAGTYGDSTHYPVITTDSKGRVTSVTTQVVSGGGGGFTAGGDLSGSSTSQSVSHISGASGNFDWLATVHNPSITHLPETTDTGATNLTINAQNAFSGAVTNVYGGSLYLQAGAASDTAPGASINLSGASPRSQGNDSDIQFIADQYQFSAATTASANTFILDPINGDFYANSASPAPSLGSSAKYWNTTYTNNLYVNQITNTTAPTANQVLVQNASANGIEWSGPVLGKLINTSGVGGSAAITLNQNQWTQINLWSSGISNGVTANTTDGYMHFTTAGWYQDIADISFIASAGSQLQFALIKNGVVDMTSSCLITTGSTNDQAYIGDLDTYAVGDVVGVVVQLLNNPSTSFQLTYARFSEILVR